MSISRGNDCLGKKSFDSVALAKQAAKRRKGRDVYRCNVCGMFHVGGNARSYRLVRNEKRKKHE